MDIDAHLQTMQDREIIDGVMEIFEELNRRTRAGEALPPVIEIAWLAMSADIEMNNDGPDELLENGDAYITALLEVGAPATAERLKVALADPDHADLDEWEQNLGELELALLQYFTKHKEAFRSF